MTMIKAMPTRRPNGLLLLGLAVLFMLLPAMLAAADIDGRERHQSVSTDADVSSSEFQ